MKKKDVLALEFYSNDLNKNITIREYFKQLLKTLWTEREGFSGKRPFGNSGWTSDLEIALINAGAIKGEVEDNDGYCELVSIADNSDKYILSLIAAL